MKGVQVTNINAPADGGLGWSEAVRRSGGNSHPDLFIFEVGDQYDLVEIEDGPLRLVMFPEAWRREEAEEWLAAQNWRSAHPRRAFAVGQRLPQLHRYLDLPCLGVISLMSCKVRIRGAKVEFVTATWLSNIWRESRLMPRGYIWPPFYGVLAQGPD